MGSYSETVVNEAFGRLLRRKRVEAGLSQTALARHAEVEHSLISRLESGRRPPTRQSMAKIIPKLNLTADEIAQLYTLAGFMYNANATPLRQMAREALVLHGFDEDIVNAISQAWETLVAGAQAMQEQRITDPDTPARAYFTAALR